MSRIKKLLPIAVCILIAGCYAPTDHTHDRVCVVDVGCTGWGLACDYWCYEDITDIECLDKGNGGSAYNTGDNSFWTENTTCEELCASLESPYPDESYVWNTDPEDIYFGRCEVE